VSLIEHDDTLCTELLRDLFGNLGIEKIMEGVDDDVDKGHLSQSNENQLCFPRRSDEIRTHHSTQSEIWTDPLLPSVVLDILQREHSFRKEISRFASPEFLENDERG